MFSYTLFFQVAIYAQVLIQFQKEVCSFRENYKSKCCISVTKWVIKLATQKIGATQGCLLVNRF